MIALKRGCLFATIFFLLIASFLFYDTALPNVYASPSEVSDDWPMFRHDPRHTGYSTSEAPNTNNTLWIKDWAQYEISIDPTVVDGRIFFYSTFGSDYWSTYNKINCINSSTGYSIWSKDFDHYIVPPSSLSHAVVDGRVFGGFYCLNSSTGANIWTYGSGGSAPVVVDGGKVFITEDPTPQYPYCFEASTGYIMWIADYLSGARGCPAAADGKVFVWAIYSGSFKIYALNATTGAQIWNYTGADATYTSPVVVDGRVFVGSEDHKIYCLNENTGNLIWSYETGDEISEYCSPAVVDGKVYVGSADGKLYCLNALTGASIWNYTTKGQITYSSPTIADGKIFVGSTYTFYNYYENWVYALNESTGSLIWSYRRTENAYFYSPVIAEGKLFVRTSDGKLYCFGPPPVLTVQTNGVSSHTPVTITLNGTSVGTAHDNSPPQITNI